MASSCWWASEKLMADGHPRWMEYRWEIGQLVLITSKFQSSQFTVSNLKVEKFSFTPHRKVAPLTAETRISYLLSTTTSSPITLINDLLFRLLFHSQVRIQIQGFLRWRSSGPVQYIDFITWIVNGHPQPVRKGPPLCFKKNTCLEHTIVMMTHTQWESFMRGTSRKEPHRRWWWWWWWWCDREQLLRWPKRGLGPSQPFSLGH